MTVRPRPNRLALISAPDTFVCWWVRPCAGQGCFWGVLWLAAGEGPTGSSDLPASREGGVWLQALSPEGMCLSWLDCLVRYWQDASSHMVLMSVLGGESRWACMYGTLPNPSTFCFSFAKGHSFFACLLMHWCQGFVRGVVLLATGSVYIECLM